MRTALAMVTLLAGCSNYTTWQPDRSKPIQVRVIGMSDETVQQVSYGAEMWNEACGRQVFELVIADREEAGALNVAMESGLAGVGVEYETEDRAVIKLRVLHYPEEFAHEAGHLLIGYGYGGDEHSAEPGSVMRNPLSGPGRERITEADRELGCRL